MSVTKPALTPSMIAAAPDMLEALEAILDADGNMQEITAIAQTAIARAKGEQP